jgi:serpin B
MQNAECKLLASGNTKFALELYYSYKFINKNIVFSPYNISLLMAVAYAGSRNRTEKQIAEVMHFEPQGQQIHSAFANIERILEDCNLGRTNLITANSIWLLSDHRPSGTFKKLIEENYKANLEECSSTCSAEEVTRAINRWVASSTRNLIRNMIGSIDPRAAIILASAIYFQGEWEKRFKKRYTQKEVFHLNQNEHIKVPMMKQGGQFRYTEMDNMKILDLPYTGKNQSMLIVLPIQIDGIRSLYDLLSIEKLSAWEERLEKRLVLASIPKFRIEDSSYLKQTLTSMGINDAFNPATADFSGLTDHAEGICIGEVIHKAVLDLDEEGTKAAAATAAVLMTGRATRDELTPVEFIADHPFMFIIRDWPSGSILFMGKVLNPNIQRN